MDAAKATLEDVVDWIASRWKSPKKLQQCVEHVAKHQTSELLELLRAAEPVLAEMPPDQWAAAEEHWLRYREWALRMQKEHAEVA